MRNTHTSYQDFSQTSATPLLEHDWSFRHGTLSNQSTAPRHNLHHFLSAPQARDDGSVQEGVATTSRNYEFSPRFTNSLLNGSDVNAGLGSEHRHLRECSLLDHSDVDSGVEAEFSPQETPSTVDDGDGNSPWRASSASLKSTLDWDSSTRNFFSPTDYVDLPKSPPKLQATGKAISECNEKPRRQPSASRDSTEPSSSTSTSLVFLTPPSPGKQSSSPQKLPVTPEEAEEYLEKSSEFGPCSNTWVLPRTRIRRDKQAQPKPRKRKRADLRSETDGPRPRGAFKDELKREITAWTRQLRSCIRCRMQRIRCDPDLTDPSGPCFTCQRVSGPTIRSMPCLRYLVTDASLYREQQAPHQLYSKRWQSMDLVDITDWASDEMRTITLSQIFLHAPYVVEVKEFVPVKGDMLDHWWTTGSVEKIHSIPRFAIANMEKTAKTLEEFIDRNISNYISATLPRDDDFLWNTYMRAFKHSEEATTSEERSVLLDCLRLWVACRKTSNPEHICGEDKLGGDLVDDPTSRYYNCVPMPKIMISQMECIIYTKVLRPKSKHLLELLHQLIITRRKSSWLTIYLAAFIILHSCALLTRRDEETASAYNFSERFANPDSIRGHHSGAQTILAHFHYINKGNLPFTMALDPAGIQELAESAQLNSDQVHFVRQTAMWVKKRSSRMNQIKTKVAFGDDFYWLSQLYEKEWKPGPTA